MDAAVGPQPLSVLWKTAAKPPDFFFLGGGLNLKLSNDLFYIKYLSIQVKGQAGDAMWVHVLEDGHGLNSVGVPHTDVRLLSHLSCCHQHSLRMESQATKERRKQLVSNKLLSLCVGADKRVTAPGGGRGDQINTRRHDGTKCGSSGTAWQCDMVQYTQPRSTAHTHTHT